MNDDARTPDTTSFRANRMTQRVKQLSDLGDLTKVAQGGQGVVYRTPRVKTTFSESLVYKEYKPAQRTHVDFETLAKMPALVENSLTYADGEHLISIAAWPCEMVRNGSEPTGFLMPEIPDEFFVSLTTMRGVSRNRAEFQHLLNHESVLAARGIALDDVQRFRLLREVASGLGFLHSHGVCVGDISPNNLLFALTPKESIYFIDCDSMCINGVSALTQVETPGWEVPNGEAPATIYSDAYKLGLLALRLLAGDQDTRDVSDLPAHVPNMIRRIISDTLRPEPQKRPLPEVWTYQLGYAIEEAQHLKATQPAAPPATPPTPSAPSKVSAAAPNAPAPVPAPTPAPVPSTSSGPSEKAVLIGAGVAIACILLVFLIAAIVSSNSRSDSSSDSTTSRSTTSEYSAQRSTTDTYTTAESASAAPSLTWTTNPPDALQGADQGGDNSCGGGAPLGQRMVVAPAAPSGNGYTSCGFAKAVGQAYVNDAPDYKSARRISVTSPHATCSSVRRNVNPNVDCNGDAFWMQCVREGPDDAMWIACRGGNDAVVYIW